MPASRHKNSVNSHYSEVEALVCLTNRIGKLTPYIHTACALRHSSDLSKNYQFPTSRRLANVQSI
ncbi:hypothetical protein D7V92_18625 [Parabacteroides sp. CH2-D42-20]|nr:hypothetical protein [Bacteroides xylanisolvens]RLT68036.1 hypothetical protein D7V92_18625 [Parabacteroides sp. CH2-D42-20]